MSWKVASLPAGSEALTRTRTTHFPIHTGLEIVMLDPFMRWMHTLPYTDVTVYRQATLLQTMLLAVAALSFAGSFVTLLAPLPMTERLIVMGIIWTGIPVQLAGIALLRRGRFSAALMLEIGRASCRERV